MLSIVVPVFNEEESLWAFHEELMKYLPKLDKTMPAGRQGYEVIFVDDGSTDGSLAILKELEKKHPFVRIFSFRANRGKAEALTLGFQKAEGDLVVTLDADLQDQPSEIVKLLDKNRKEGIDVVCGWRKDRKDKSKMKIISKIFNFIVQKSFSLSVHDYNCGLKLYTKDAAKSLNLYGGLHRFIPILAHKQGFSIDEVAVKHVSRKYGVSKYGFSKVFKDIPDMFTMLFLVKYRYQPLHFFGFIGGGIFSIGFVLLLYLTLIKMLGHSIGTRPLLFLGILLVVVGIQIFFTGFLAELNINLSSRNRPQFPLKYESRKK